MENKINTGNGESKIYGVSMRGWIALVIVLGVLCLSAYHEDLIDVVGNGFLTAIAFYFGQKSK